MFDLIVTLFERGGPVMVPIFAVSLIAWCIIFFRLFDLSGKKRNIRTVLGRISNEPSCLSSRDTGEEIPFVESLRYIVKGALSGRRFEEAVSVGIELQRKELSTFLPTLAVLAVIAPLLGLLGTVTGMIATFNAISHHGTGDPVLLGSGISQALITTEAGLVVAIPVLIMHIYLVSKVDSIVAEIGQKTVQIVTSLRAAK